MGFFDRIFGRKDATEQELHKNIKLTEGNHGDDAPCQGNRETVCRRVENAIAQVIVSETEYYELYRDISPLELGGDDQAYPFTYGLYFNGRPKIMILILDKPWGYQRKDVVAAHELCRQKGVACMNLMLHLPNRKTYIINRIRELLND